MSLFDTTKIVSVSCNMLKKIVYKIIIIDECFHFHSDLIVSDHGAYRKRDEQTRNQTVCILS